MKNSILKLVKWFCRRLTLNEFHSAVTIFLEVLNEERHDIKFKPDEKPPHYRNFRVDMVPPLTESPLKNIQPELNWQQLKHQFRVRHGKDIAPVRRRKGAQAPPAYCTCEKCGAPSRYLYLNDGKKASQVRCKICNSLSVTHRVRRESQAKYFCPHCGYALGEWKARKDAIIFKCPNVKCPHFLNNFQTLTPQERKERQNKYNPNYKLHYQYREYHFSPGDLLPQRPELETRVNLNRIHNNYHTVGLILSCFINIGLSSRQTRDVLKGFFGLSVSHQTVINYVNASAAIISPWLDRNLPVPGKLAAGDETYIIVENQYQYTWFIIDKITRAICGYNLSNSRDTASALATIRNAYGEPGENPGEYEFIGDGLPSYDNAVMAYNESLEKPQIIRRTVVGLENINQESKDFRPLKQIVERLNRTYKFHTRPRAGFKTFSGAISLTTLFVAFYNFLRPHSFNKKSAPPISLKCLDGIDSFPKQWEVLLKQAAI
ncbi:MAG: DDE-type integrase/transposase/recombinase [Victivallaceae bacterium]|nr:DDE-type integrase/transposase/recombinase [Victivallaceae bacterium]